VNPSRLPHPLILLLAGDYLPRAFEERVHIKELR